MGVKPGTWTVSLRHGDLPENATVAENSYTVELLAGDEVVADFKVEQRIRRMRMLKSLKVSS